MNTNLTEIAYILDRSGSMAPLASAAINGFNTFLREQQQLEGEANLTLVLFDDEYLLHASAQDIRTVTPLDTSTYIPRGSTALLDAIGRTIDDIGKKLANTPEPQRPGKVIIAIFTDGYENASTDYTTERIKQMITHQRDHYQWEILFLSCSEDALQTAADYGIHAKDVALAQFSTLGVTSTATVYSKKISAMRNFARAAATQADMDTIHQSLNETYEEELKNPPKK